MTADDGIIGQTFSKQEAIKRIWSPVLLSQSKSVNGRNIDSERLFALLLWLVWSIRSAGVCLHETTTMATPETCGVRVIIRFRPVSESEKREKVKDTDFALAFPDKSTVDVKGKAGGVFSFDRVFDPSMDQLTVFKYGTQ